MLTKRIIPCLDVKEGRVVKGVNFQNMVDAGSPVELGARYSSDGADELVFLDISATIDAREHVILLAKQVAQEIFIPFTIGGGVRTVSDMENLLIAGADKVAINTAVLQNPDIITEAAKQFGSQFIVVAIDVKQTDGEWWVRSHGGTRETGRKAREWAQEVQDRGAGEILLTSIDADGTQQGIDAEITQSVSAHSSVPIIASGGIGKLEHFKDAFALANADAVLAASVFHHDTLTINDVKKYLVQQGIDIRITGEER